MMSLQNFLYSYVCMNDAHLNYFYSFIFYILLLFQNFSHNEDEIHLLNIIVDYFLQDEDILVFFCTSVYKFTLFRIRRICCSFSFLCYINSF